MNLSLCDVATLETALEKHIELKSPFFLQLWQTARQAGQDCLGCGPFPHLWHLLERHGLDLGLLVGGFLPAFHVDFQEGWLGRRTESTIFPWSPFKTPCCSCTASFCHTSRLALSRVRFESTCIGSERALSLIPTTILSLIRSSFSAPNYTIPLNYTT